MCRTLLALFLCLASISHAAVRKPNVIIIYTDDLPKLSDHTFVLILLAVNGSFPSRDTLPQTD